MAHSALPKTLVLLLLLSITATVLASSYHEEPKVASFAQALHEEPSPSPKLAQALHEEPSPSPKFGQALYEEPSPSPKFGQTTAVHDEQPAPAPKKSNPVPRSFVAVEGVVYCKPCKYIGVDTLYEATPLKGARVKLECSMIKKTTLVEKVKTDKNGYFLIEGPKSLTTYGSDQCKVSLISSPVSTCNKTTDLHAGQVGALLMPKIPRVTLPREAPVELFTVGPFAFEPSTKCA